MQALRISGLAPQCKELADPLERPSTKRLTGSPQNWGTRQSENNLRTCCEKILSSHDSCMSRGILCGILRQQQDNGNVNKT